MLRFNNDNIITGQIKQLLKEFNLPQVRVWKEGIKIFSGVFYIKNNNLCLGVVSNNTTILQTIKPYIYGESIENVTKNLIISNNLYDSYTHTYLGDYLRFYRDVKNINLMSMYNCFSNEQAKNLSIVASFVPANTDLSYPPLPGFNFDTENNNFKIYVVPVKFFENYTIGIECDTQIEIIAGIYDNDKVINYSSNASDISFYRATYVKKIGTRLNSPFLYDKLFNIDNILKENRFSSELTKRTYEQEKNLKLFIKVPSTSISSVVVLEGDFIKFSELYFDESSNRKVAFEVCNFETGTSNIDGQTFVFKGADKERKYISRPQLLDFNSALSYPFADRLIEYIFEGVITSEDKVPKNISRIQKRLIQRYNEYVKDENGDLIYLTDVNGNYVLSNSTTISKQDFDSLPKTDPTRKMVIPIHKYIGTESVIYQTSLWSTKLRNVCYDAIMNFNGENNLNVNKFDMNGFIDKDSEQIIGEYKEEN
jgi:hypothetical protein